MFNEQGLLSSRVFVKNSTLADSREESAARADERRSAEHFDKGANSYAAGYGERSSSGHSFRARRAKTQALLGSGPLGNLLDVGGASGVYFDALKSQVNAYHIVDISPLMISQAQKIKSGNVPLHCHVASAYELPYPSDHFDTVLAMGVLEYLDEPWRALEEMARVTRPGGLILVSYPNIESPMRRMSNAIYRILRKPTSFAPTLVFSADRVRAAADKLKLEPSCVAGYNAQIVPFPLTWRLRMVAYYLAETLEPFLGRFGNLWGTGFIVKYQKAPQSIGAISPGSN